MAPKTPPKKPKSRATKPATKTPPAPGKRPRGRPPKSAATPPPPTPPITGPDFSRPGWTHHRRTEYARWADAESLYRQKGAWSGHVKAVKEMAEIAEQSDRDSRRIERELSGFTLRQHIDSMRAEAEADGSWVAAQKFAEMASKLETAGVQATTTWADIIDGLLLLPPAEIQALIIQLQTKLSG